MNEEFHLPGRRFVVDFTDKISKRKDVEMAQRAISFHYKLFDLSGKALESSEGAAPITFIEGLKQIIPGLEKELVTMEKGGKKRVNVPAAEAYGLKNASLVIKVPRSKLPAETVQIGDQFQGEHGEAVLMLTVTECSDSEVTLDGNHPLAGQDLVFDVEVTAVREARDEELKSSCCSQGRCESKDCGNGCGSR